MRAIFLAIFFWAIGGFAAFNLTWGIPAVSLDSNPPVGDSDSNPTIAIDLVGNAVATWGRTNGNKASEDIWAASYNHASRVWTGAVKVSGGGSATNASVKMDASGYAVIVWEEGFPTQIMSRTFSSAGVWTPALSAAPSFVCLSRGVQECPQLVVNAKGHALVVWMESLGGVTRICSAHKPIESAWVNLGAISSKDNNAEIHLPSPIALNAFGDGVAVWQEINKGSVAIYGARYVGNVWLDPILISSGAQATVGIDAGGRAVFVWNQEKVIQSKTLVRGILSEPLAVSNPLFAARHPCVAVDDTGNAVVVFERYDRAVMHKFVTGAILPVNSAAWTAPVDISVPSSAEDDKAGYPRLCLNAIGDGVVVWKEFDGTHMLIQGAGYSLGTWSFIRTLSSTSGNAGALDATYGLGVALNLAGNIFAIWPEDPSGSDTQHIKAAPGEKEIQHIKAAPGVGLAVVGPLPPVLAPESVVFGIGKGFQVVHRFPAHADRINILDWASPGGVAYYKIYRGTLGSLIGTSSTPHYEDHQRVPKEKMTYLITSVDKNEHESGPMAIIVN